MASTIRLANTITWAKSFMAYLDPTLQPNNEPALTCANLIKQTILGPPFVWRWNRVSTGFVCTGLTQDYLLSAWAASAAFALNTVIVDTNGNCQKVTVAGTSGASAPTWNATQFGNTTDGTITWNNLGAVSGAAAAYSLGFIETASVLDSNVTPIKWFEIASHICLGIDSTQGRPQRIAAQKDDGAGNITFRLMPAPDKPYPVAITLQQKPTLFATPNDTWEPIPDEYSYIYNWGFLALMFMYNDDPRWSMANQKFVAALLAAQQGLTETERNIFLNNWEALTGQPSQNAIRMQQGNQARGA